MCFRVCVRVMADLTAQQQERINKSSTDRLRTIATRRGFSEDEVATMEREELKYVETQFVAAQNLEFRDNRGEEDSEVFRDATEQYDPRSGQNSDYRMLQLQYKMKKLELEAQRGARKLELEAEAEREARRANFETRKVEAEIRKMEIEKEIRLAEIKAQSAENFQATQSDREQPRRHPPRTTLWPVAPKDMGILYVTYLPLCPLRTRTYHNFLTL